MTRGAWRVLLATAVGVSLASATPAIGAGRSGGPPASQAAARPPAGPGPGGSPAAVLSGVPPLKVRVPGSAHRFCGRLEWKWVHWYRNWYALRNDDYADSECLINFADLPNYRVGSSTAHSNTSQNQAFPQIIDGCAWGICSPGTPLPERWTGLRHVYATVTTRQHAAGLWNSSFDIWFGKGNHRTGQARGTELMIWLGTAGTRSGPAPVITIDNARWHLHHWRACNLFGCWNYIQFWRVRPTISVRHFDLVPFFRYASIPGTGYSATRQRQPALSKSWYLWNIEYGNEIWRGGNGLGVSFFRIQGLRILPFTPPKH